MKTRNTITLLFFLLVVFNSKLSSQESKQREWHNHSNYKQEIIENIKNSPFLKKKTLSTKIPIPKTERDLNKKNMFSDFEIVNGINIAWVNYGRDIGLESNGTQYHPDLGQFGNIMDRVAESGGNVIRWWYHTNGSTNPVFDNNDDYVIENPDFFISDMKAILDLAVEKNVQMQICLWSFDMLKGGQWNVNSSRNKNLLVSEPHLQAYLDKCLKPMVEAIGNHPGLYAWEIFNEPEGMTTEYASHWSDFTDKISISDVQKAVNRMAGAIRTVSPDVKVTNGALGFTSMVDNSNTGYYNNYTDQRLFEKGGDPNGYLDFYNVHYYDWAGIDGSPFHQNFSDQSLDKPTVVAEYYPQDTFGVSAGDLGTTLVNRGWHGSLVWSWTDRGWDDMRPVVENLSDQVVLNIDDFDVNEISVYPVPVQNKVTLSGLPGVPSKVEIYDILGSRIKVNDPLLDRGDLTLNLSTYESGVYLVVISSADGINITKRIIKQ